MKALHKLHKLHKARLHKLQKTDEPRREALFHAGLLRF